LLFDLRVHARFEQRDRDEEGEPKPERDDDVGRGRARAYQIGERKTHDLRASRGQMPEPALKPERRQPERRKHEERARQTPMRQIDPKDHHYDGAAARRLPEGRK